MNSPIFPIALAALLSLTSPLFGNAAEPENSFQSLKVDVKLYTNRDYTLVEAPEFLMGKTLLHTSIEGYTIECTTPGDLYILTLSQDNPANQSTLLLNRGFEKVDTPEFQMSQGDVHRAFAYRKRMESGEKLAVRKTTLPVLGDGIEIKLLTVGSPDSPPSPKLRNRRSPA